MFIHITMQEVVKFCFPALTARPSELRSQWTEVRFASLLSGGFIISAIVVNPQERILAKRTSVQCSLPKSVLRGC